MAGGNDFEFFPDDDDADGESKKVLTLKQDHVGAVFARVVEDIRGQLTDDDMVVDMELSFKNVVAQKGGIPIIAPKTSQSGMEIRLATRVRKG